MRTIRHPLSGAVYDLNDDGTITVALDGETGLFTKDGVWISGAVRTADPHVCGWIGGKEMVSRHRQNAENFQAANASGGAA